MNIKTGRPDHIEDVIAALHKGKWFDWVDVKNKTYANLRLAKKVWKTGGDELIDNPITELPTESELNTKLAEMQADFDSKNKEYQLNRAREYPHVSEQLDYIFHNGLAKWKTDIVQPVKDKYPKP